MTQYNGQSKQQLERKPFLNLSIPPISPFLRGPSRPPVLKQLPFKADSSRLQKTLFLLVKNGLDLGPSKGLDRGRAGALIKFALSMGKSKVRTTVYVRARSRGGGAPLPPPFARAARPLASNAHRNPQHPPTCLCISRAPPLSLRRVPLLTSSPPPREGRTSRSSRGGSRRVMLGVHEREPMA